MNTQNETVVSPEMMEHLRDLALDRGYEPVPDFLNEKAQELLKGGAVASMDADMKRKLKNEAKRMRRAGVPGY